jgi:hypothetical protein
MKVVKVLVRDGFSTMHDGAFGPGEGEMLLSVAQKYPMFVTILEDEDAAKKKNANAKALAQAEFAASEKQAKIAPTTKKKGSGPVTRTTAKSIRKTTTRKPKK